MKSLLFAASLAIAGFGAVNTATAQNIGIQYAKMPIGSAAYYAHTNGEKWVDVYKGVQRGQHVVERFKGHRVSTGRPFQTRYYDKQGRLIYFRAYGDRSKPYKITFKPFDCYYVVGNCQHTRRFTGNGYVHSGTSEKWVMSTQKAGKGFKSQWYKKREPDGGNTYTTKLGQYNLRTIEAWGSKGQYNIKLVKLVNGS